MTAYWRLANAVYRFVPSKWMRKWAHDYLRKHGGVVAYPGPHHFTIMATSTIEVECGVRNGGAERFELRAGDTMQITIDERRAKLYVYPLRANLH